MKKLFLSIFQIFFVVFFIPLSSFADAGNTRVHMLRLLPGEDPRLKLESFVSEKKLNAVVVISAVGSLTEASLRFANQDKSKLLKGHFEILSLSGTLSAAGGSHLHLSIADEKGKTWGGHLAEGSKIYTTLEIALMEITDIEFTREIDKASGYKELKINPIKVK